MIKQFELEQLETIMEIWLTTNKKAHDFIETVYWEDHFEQVKQLLPLSHLKVFEEGGVVKGFIGLIENYIAGLFVLEAYQGQGIGKKLLEDVKKYQETLTLDVYVQNEKAVNFYQANGFKVVNEKLNEETHHMEYTMKWNK